MGLVTHVDARCDRCAGKDVFASLDAAAEAGWTALDDGKALCPRCVGSYEWGLGQIRKAGRYLADHAEDFLAMGETVSEDGMSFSITIASDRIFAIKASKEVLVLQD